MANKQYFQTAPQWCGTRLEFCGNLPHRIGGLRPSMVDLQGYFGYNKDKEVDAVCGKIYTIDEIKAIASPIAESHGVAALYLFGSYARGEATSDSDLDFRIEKGRIRTIFQLGSLLCDL